MNESKGDVGNRRSQRIARWGVLGALLALVVLAFCLLPVDPRCVPLIIRSFRDVQIPLPQGCTSTTDPFEGETIQWLEDDRKSRGLIFKSRIVCTPREADGTRRFDLLNDPRWLPGYVPQTYQFRRTVVIFPTKKGVAPNSPVVAEVVLVPWTRYLSQISRECKGKFSMW